MQKEIGYKSDKPGYAGLIDEAQNYMVVQVMTPDRRCCGRPVFVDCFVLRLKSAVGGIGCPFAQGMSPQNRATEVFTKGGLHSDIVSCLACWEHI